MEKRREDLQLLEENAPPLEEVQPLQEPEPGVVAPECAPIPLGVPAQPMLEPGGVVPDHKPTPIPLGMPEAPKHRYPSRARRPTDFYGEYITH